jgi:LCP family protein required for cell wall assembly
LSSVKKILLIANILLLGLLTLLAACRSNNPPQMQETPLSFSKEMELLKATSSPGEVEDSESSSDEENYTPAPEVVTTEDTQPTQILTPTATIPPPAQVVNLPPGVEVLVLMGTDYESPYIGRTDTIILLFLNRQTGSASLISIPRDLFVYRPGRGMDRINTTYLLGGADLVSDTLEYNLGVRPQHWVLAHFDDFRRIVDELGGIEVDVSTPLPNDCGGVPPGVFHMSGEVALCYVRERRTTSDFDRSLRQQEVLRVIFRRFMTLENLYKLPDWYASYNQSIQSDLGLLDLLGYLPFALHLQDGDSIHQFQIDWDDVIQWHIPETGAWVLLPNKYKIAPIMQRAVDALSQSVPTSEAMATRIAMLTITPTPSVTPTSTQLP